MSEPFIVVHGPGVSDRVLRLADVIITDRGSPRELAALFAGCPGLTLVLVVDPGTSYRSVRRAAVAAYQVCIGQFGAQSPGA
ncbi:hypothetical protein [Actinoplanes sp. NPDC089786]|uniref:hypothetical protein n=1 Tax=Actinoplanes sp. NPDC089786 TaxID=3155185 RepID=UPI00343D09F8